MAEIFKGESEAATIGEGAAIVAAGGLGVILALFGLFALSSINGA